MFLIIEHDTVDDKEEFRDCVYIIHSMISVEDVMPSPLLKPCFINFKKKKERMIKQTHTHSYMYIYIIYT